MARVTPDGRRPLAFAWLLVPVLLTQGCLFGDDACETRCKQWGSFIDACYDDLAEEHIHATCYPDPEGSVTEDGQIDDEAESTECASGRDARSSCLGTWRSRRDLLDDESFTEAVESCEEDSEYHLLIEDRDCEGMIHLLFGD